MLDRADKHRPLRAVVVAASAPVQYRPLKRLNHSVDLVWREQLTDDEVTEVFEESGLLVCQFHRDSTFRNSRIAHRFSGESTIRQFRRTEGAFITERSSSFMSSILAG